MIELVLPLVVRIERDAPPARTDALEAAARAALLMLTTDRPEWRPAVEAWDRQRIRKVVRRARGAEWRRASALDGLDVVSGTAEVRVYPPIPIRGALHADGSVVGGGAWPPELARLQVSGTELDDPSPPADPPRDVPLILLTPFVEMTVGKAMAQAAHAAQLGWRASSALQRDAWRSSGFALAVRAATTGQWRAALAAGAPVVHDAGFTEVAPNTQTAAAILPWL